MAVTLYPRQRQILSFVNQYIQRRGYSPTLKEIAKALGIISLATISEQLRAMEAKGVLKRIHGKNRGIKISAKYTEETKNEISLPVLGFIAAGKPLEPYTDPNATFFVPQSLISGKRRAFILQVKGDSMIEEGILDGDYVVVEEQEEARNGEIVVALLENGLATLKRFFKEATRIRLEPANSKMSPIFAKNVKIQGKVVGLVRRY